MTKVGLHHGWHTRGYVPHFDMPGLYQFITFRLKDSLPQSLIRAAHQAATAGSDEYFGSLDGELDRGLGSCALQRPDCAAIVESCLLRNDGVRYNLHGWVTMPNHVHTLIEVIPGHPLATTIRSWKSFSAAAINRAIGQSGALWQEDYFDRMIRDEEHYRNTLEYIRYNPVRAGLCTRPEQWRFGSAYERS